MNGFYVINIMRHLMELMWNT